MKIRKGEGKRGKTQMVKGIVQSKKREKTEEQQQSRLVRQREDGRHKL